MNSIEVEQGSDEWLAIRAKHFTASEAPAMMGASKYQTRSDLLKQKATGIVPEVDAFKQNLFDAGHEAEFLARPIVERIIGKELFPETGWMEIDGLKLLASFDGLTMAGDIAWESKLFNATLADAVRANSIEPHYYWQLEQQLLVSGASKVYFTTSDGTPENTVGMWYASIPERRAKLIAGWKQFQADLAEYQHVETVAAPVAAPVESLPAVMVQVSGSITIADNFKVFEVALRDFLDNKFIRKPETDQDFVDLDLQIKAMKDAEKALDGAEVQMLAQAEPIAAAKRTKDMLKELVRSNRLMAETLLKNEKVNRKAAIITDGRAEIEKHVAMLNKRIGGNWMPLASAQPIAEATHGLKSLDSMKNKVADTVASEKVRLSEIADTIEINRKQLVGEAHDFIFMFPDFAQVCTKNTQDFALLVGSRMAVEEQRKQAERAAADARTAAAVAAAVEAERIAEAKRAAEAARALTANNQTQFEDQRGKTEDATHAQPQATAAPQAPAASTPPTSEAMAAHHDANDKAILDDFMGLLPISATEKAGIRGYIMKWEKYRAARLMQVAA